MNYHTYYLKLNNFLLIHSLFIYFFIYKSDWDDSVTICELQTYMLVRTICRCQYLSCLTKEKTSFFELMTLINRFPSLELVHESRFVKIVA